MFISYRSDSHCPYQTLSPEKPKSPLTEDVKSAYDSFDEGDNGCDWSVVKDSRKTPDSWRDMSFRVLLSTTT